MKFKINNKTWYAVLLAGIFTFLLYSLNYTDFRKFRIKLNPDTKKIEATQSSLTFTLPEISANKERVLLVELVLKKESEESPEVTVTVSLNDHEIRNLRQSSEGKKKYFINIPQNLMSDKKNILELTGGSHWKLEYLEIKNLYGFSTGLLSLIILDRHSTDYGSLGLPALCLIFILLATAGYFLVEKELIRSTGKFYKFLSIFLVVFLTIAFLLPLISNYRLLFSLKTVILFFAVIYFPVFKKPVKTIYTKVKTLYSKSKTVYFPAFKTGLKAPKGKNIIFYLLLVIMFLSTFSIYVIYRQHYVGGCDWYGYYNQARLMRSLKIHQETRLDPNEYPAAAPLSYFVKDGKTIPQYPPGFPLLLALGGFLGLEYYVTPVIGILSVILMYLFIILLTANRWIALMFSTLWAFAPIVHYGSTSIMSDLVAAFFIMLSLYLFYKEKLGYSGLALGFSLAVRPTNILFCIVFLPLLLRKKPREWLKFGLFFSIPASLYGIYNWLVYGFPWKSGYANLSSDLVSYVFVDHLHFYLKELVVQLTPLIIIPAVIPFFIKKGTASPPYKGNGIDKNHRNEENAYSKSKLLQSIIKKKHVYFYGVWFLVFFIFYCFWKSGGDVWWWTRFLLPGLPPLFFLSAMGVKEILTWAKSKGKHAGRYIGVTCAALTLAAVVYFIDYGHKHVEIWQIGKGDLYYSYVKQVARTVPPNSVVGAIEFSGVLRLYGGLESFFYHHINSPKLIGDMLDKNVPVYVIGEPWNLQHKALRKIYKLFNYKVVKGTKGPGGYYLLIEITGRRQPAQL